MSLGECLGHPIIWIPMSFSTQKYQCYQTIKPESRLVQTKGQACPRMHQAQQELLVSKFGVDNVIFLCVINFLYVLCGLA